MEEEKLLLLKDMFFILGHSIESKEDLLSITLNQKYLRSAELKTKIAELKPSLKKYYDSCKLNCLHKNSLVKQTFPISNMLRQILKCNGLRLKPKVVCKGYINNKKLFERYYIILKVNTGTIESNTNN